MKKKQILFYVIVMIILLTTSVYATISAELGFKIKTSSSKIYPGDTFSITVGLDKVETDKKIKAVEGYIDINEDILESLTVDSVVTNSEGKVEINEDNVLTLYDSEEMNSSSETGIIVNSNPKSKDGDFRIVITFAEPVEGDVDLLTINFKVKEDAEPGEYSSAIVYKVFKLFADDASEKEKLDDKTIKVVVDPKSGNPNQNNTVNNSENKVNNEAQKPENKPVNNTQTKPENRPENKPENKAQNPSTNQEQQRPQNNQQQGGTQNPTDGSGNNGQQGGTQQQQQGQTGQTSSGNDQTVSPTDLPKTGYRMIIIPIVVIAILGFIFYKKYSKYNSYHE